MISNECGYYSGSYSLTREDYFKAPCAHTSEEVEKKSLLCDKNIVRLPAGKEYRLKWEKLGIIWQESLNERMVLAYALLPKGWHLKETDIFSSDLIDSNQLVRVKIFIKTTTYDFEASASFI